MTRRATTNDHVLANHSRIHDAHFNVVVFLVLNSFGSAQHGVLFVFMTFMEAWGRPSGEFIQDDDQNIEQTDHDDEHHKEGHHVSLPRVAQTFVTINRFLEAIGLKHDTSEADEDSTEQQELFDCVVIEKELDNFVLFFLFAEVYARCGKFHFFLFLRLRIILSLDLVLDMFNVVANAEVHVVAGLGLD